MKLKTSADFQMPKDPFSVKTSAEFTSSSRQPRLAAACFSLPKAKHWAPRGFSGRRLSRGPWWAASPASPVVLKSYRSKGCELNPGAEKIKEGHPSFSVLLVFPRN